MNFASERLRDDVFQNKPGSFSYKYPGQPGIRPRQTRILSPMFDVQELPSPSAVQKKTTHTHDDPSSRTLNNSHRVSSWTIENQRHPKTARVEPSSRTLNNSHRVSSCTIENQRHPKTARVEPSSITPNNSCRVSSWKIDHLRRPHTAREDRCWEMSLCGRDERSDICKDQSRSPVNKTHDCCRLEVATYKLFSSKIKHHENGMKLTKVLTKVTRTRYPPSAARESYRER